MPNEEPDIQRRCISYSLVIPVPGTCPPPQLILHHSLPYPLCSEHHKTLVPARTGLGCLGCLPRARHRSRVGRLHAPEDSAQGHFLLACPPPALRAGLASSLQSSLIPVPIWCCTCFLIASGLGAGDCVVILVFAARSAGQLGEPLVVQRGWLTGCSEMRLEEEVEDLPEGPSFHYTLLPLA